MRKLLKIYQQVSNEYKKNSVKIWLPNLCHFDWGYTIQEMKDNQLF